MRIPSLEAKRDRGQERGHSGAKMHLQSDSLGKADCVLQDEEGSLTSSFREGPSLVSTHARQQLPPWIPRKMGTLERSRPRLGRIQIFSGGKTECESGSKGTPGGSGFFFLKQDMAQQGAAVPGHTWPVSAWRLQGA